MRHTVLRFKQAIVIPLALGLASSPAGLQFYGASESYAQTPPAIDSAQQRCDELAGDPRDPSQVGRGVPFAKIQVTEALPACQAAANVAPVQPHYQFLYGRVLQKAERYDEAFQQYNSAAAGGVAGAMHNLGVFYENGLGVATSDAEAQSWYRRAEQARRVEETNKAAAIAQRNGGAESEPETASRGSAAADSTSEDNTALWGLAGLFAGAIALGVLTSDNSQSSSGASNAADQQYGESQEQQRERNEELNEDFLQQVTNDNEEH
ncbi:hypothetical protein [Candidatus Binatus sp.]|uniref:hypothetical protein n=1 Tax=Candidatus Binatus sp. TaxID=2811406 RepID=UPI003C719EE4